MGFSPLLTCAPDCSLQFDKTAVRVTPRQTRQEKKPVCMYVCLFEHYVKIRSITISNVQILQT